MTPLTYSYSRQVCLQSHRAAATYVVVIFHSSTVHCPQSDHLFSRAKDGEPMNNTRQKHPDTLGLSDQRFALSPLKRE